MFWQDCSHSKKMREKENFETRVKTNCKYIFDRPGSKMKTVKLLKHTHTQTQTHTNFQENGSFVHTNIEKKNSRLQKLSKMQFSCFHTRIQIVFRRTKKVFYETCVL
jgi:hypothetical protein